MESDESFKICSDNIFSTQKSFSILISQTALKKYTNGLERALNFEENIPIFLDTNVLLDYYKISFTEREELSKFFTQNKDRIFITKQIEQEFLRHRIDHIRSYLKSLDEFVNSYKNIKSEIERLKNGEIKGFDYYVDNNVILKNDYQDLRTELKNFNDTIKEKLKALFSESDFEEQILEKEKKIEEIRKRLEGQADIERIDPLLEIVAEFKVTDELSKEEFECIKLQFDSLNDKYQTVKSDQNFNWKYTFPGCGDKKDDPYGDFIIYHEIIKYLKNNNCDAVYLTNDVEKNDWLLRKKAELIPYTHYIINTFSLTENTLFIFHAKDKIRVSYSPIYVDKAEQAELKPVEETCIQKLEPDLPTDNQESEISVNIIGQIDLSDYESIGHFSVYDDITKKEFIKELVESEKWASNYGNGFVGLNSFVMKYLGGKGYNFRTSYAIKDQLLSEGEIETYTHKPDNPFYNEVVAIKVKSK